jgi:hypothetical protein
MTAFCKLYWKDYWNIFDVIIIIISLIFVILDWKINNKQLQAFLKIRGIFRLLRIFILIRKLNTLRIKRDLQKKRQLRFGIDLRTPLERVLEILNTVRDNLDSSEKKVFEDLNFCIKIISSN